MFTSLYAFQFTVELLLGVCVNLANDTFTCLLFKQVR
jgi:hypothetical protein